LELLTDIPYSLQSICDIVSRISATTRTDYLRLDISTVLRIMRCDIPTSHILNRFELAIHLTDASKRDPRSSVELAVFDEDVGRVCFW
jgi:hypothetical protein